MTILLVAGSPSSPSRSTRLLQHVGNKIASLGHACDTLHVLDLPAQALLRANFADPDIKAAQALVAKADAVVVATPVYKAAYSGALKTFLDLLAQDGMAGKLALPIATGGSQSHMLALDYALRPVLSALGARHILPSIYATDAQVAWTSESGLALDPAIARRVEDGVRQLDANLPALRTGLTTEFAPIPFSQVRCSV